jgi:hypothetical protein
VNYWIRHGGNGAEREDVRESLTDVEKELDRMVAELAKYQETGMEQPAETVLNALTNEY